MAPSVTESASLCVVVKTGDQKMQFGSISVLISDKNAVAPLIVIPVPTLIELFVGSNVIERTVPTVSTVHSRISLYQ